MSRRLPSRIRRRGVRSIGHELDLREHRLEHESTSDRPAGCRQDVRRECGRRRGRRWHRCLGVDDELQEIEQAAKHKAGHIALMQPQLWPMLIVGVGLAAF